MPSLLMELVAPRSRNVALPGTAARNSGGAELLQAIALSATLCSRLPELVTLKSSSVLVVSLAFTTSLSLSYQLLLVIKCCNTFMASSVFLDFSLGV